MTPEFSRGAAHLIGKGVSLVLICFALLVGDILILLSGPVVLLVFSVGLFCYTYGRSTAECRGPPLVATPPILVAKSSTAFFAMILLVAGVFTVYFNTDTFQGRIFTTICWVIIAPSVYRLTMAEQSNEERRQSALLSWKQKSASLQDDSTQLLDGFAAECSSLEAEKATAEDLLRLAKDKIVGLESKVERFERERSSNEDDDVNFGRGD